MERKNSNSEVGGSNAPQGARSSWVRVSKDNPCPICGKPDWCLISADGSAVICPRVKSDKPAGEAGFYHKLGEGDYHPSTSTPLKASSKDKDFPLATLSRRHLVYEALLRELPLVAKHRNDLVRRGLPTDLIEDNGYKTLPDGDRRSIVKKVRAAGKVAGVPGFYRLGDGNGGEPDLNGYPGMLIPIRGLNLSIVGLQIRRDSSDSGGKYVWLSSSGKDYGSSPGSPAHLAFPDDVSTTETVYITEGALKADVIAHFVKCPVVACAGVNSYRKAVEMVVKLLPRNVIIAFDNDKYDNDVVRRCADELETILLFHHFNVYEAQWPREYKGLDDFLVSNGGELKLRTIKKAKVAPIVSYKESQANSSKTDIQSNNEALRAIAELRHLATHIIAPIELYPFAFPFCSCSYCTAVKEWQEGLVPSNGDKESEFSKIATKALPDFDDHADLREFHDGLARLNKQYLGLGEESLMCGRWGMVRSCENGHYLLKRLVCGREWCPYCGKKHSEAHNRRISRVVPRVFTMDSVGYFVFEVPVILRTYFRDVAKLREARHYLHRQLKREFNTRGVSRWHYYGEPVKMGDDGSVVELGDYNPHLNVLLEHGFVGKCQLKRVRKLWSQWVFRSCGKAYYKTAPVYYKFNKAPGKKWHLVSYVTRPTFTQLNDDNKQLAEGLFSFNNMSWFGKFSAADKKKGRERLDAWLSTLPASTKRSIVEVQALDDFNSGKCPICGSPLKEESLSKVIDFDIIREFGGGLYEVRAPPWSWVYSDDKGLQGYKKEPIYV